MRKPSICVAIVNNDLRAIKEIEPLVDLFEVRIDLIGEGWQDVARQLEKPWIACNRRQEEGGSWKKGETERTAELLKAIDLGANIIDIELATKDLERMVNEVKKKATCLISFHDFEGTPPYDRLKEKVEKQIEAGADICKVVTTARKFQDNLTTLQLIKDFPKARVVSFAMISPSRTISERAMPPSPAETCRMIRKVMLGNRW